MAGKAEFLAHVESGLTTVAQAWAVTRRDGRVFGFTDHDCDLAFDGVTFKADTGLSARALEQTTGLAVDNSEAIGALSDLSVTEVDISAGRFDGAEVKAWAVNWQDPGQRLLLFAGTIGEITRSGGAFRAELIGLSEGLNRVQGRAYHRRSAGLEGDRLCGEEIDRDTYRETAVVLAVEDQKVLHLSGLDGFAPRAFERGRLDVISGAAAGLAGAIKRDREADGARHVELWEALRADIAPGDLVRVWTGTDGSAQAAYELFGDLTNFDAFPHIPEEERLVSIPVPEGAPSGGGGAK
ncbi:MAG: hypothetical protein CR993_01670 [Rhodobacterales bacterium]|nr:MAG: hypothetical protein CR993_01670 [Rhodobacterales bacterium]